MAVNQNGYVLLSPDVNTTFRRHRAQRLSMKMMEASEETLPEDAGLHPHRLHPQDNTLTDDEGNTFGATLRKRWCAWQCWCSSLRSKARMVLGGNRFHQLDELPEDEEEQKEIHSTVSEFIQASKVTAC